MSKGGVVQMLVIAKPWLAKNDLHLSHIGICRHSYGHCCCQCQTCNQGSHQAHCLQVASEHCCPPLDIRKGPVSFVCSKNFALVIREHLEFQWRHTPSIDNPADQPNQEGQVKSVFLWCNGTAWRHNPEKWPDISLIGKLWAWGILDSDPGTVNQVCQIRMLKLCFWALQLAVPCALLVQYLHTVPVAE